MEPNYWNKEISMDVDTPASQGVTDLDLQHHVAQNNPMCVGGAVFSHNDNMNMYKFATNMAKDEFHRIVRNQSGYLMNEKKEQCLTILRNVNGDEMSNPCYTRYSENVVSDINENKTFHNLTDVSPLSNFFGQRIANPVETNQFRNNITHNQRSFFDNSNYEFSADRCKYITYTETYKETRVESSENLQARPGYQSARGIDLSLNQRSHFEGKLYGQEFSITRDIDSVFNDNNLNVKGIKPEVTSTSKLLTSLNEFLKPTNTKEKFLEKDTNEIKSSKVNNEQQMENEYQISQNSSVALKHLLSAKRQNEEIYNESHSTLSGNAKTFNDPSLKNALDLTKPPEDNKLKESLENQNESMSKDFKENITEVCLGKITESCTNKINSWQGFSEIPPLSTLAEKALPEKVINTTNENLNLQETNKQEHVSCDNLNTKKVDLEQTSSLKEVEVTGETKLSPSNEHKKFKKCYDVDVNLQRKTKSNLINNINEERRVQTLRKAKIFSLRKLNKTRKKLLRKKISTKKTNVKVTIEKTRILPKRSAACKKHRSSKNTVLLVSEMKSNSSLKRRRLSRLTHTCKTREPRGNKKVNLNLKLKSNNFHGRVTRSSGPISNSEHLENLNIVKKQLKPYYKKKSKNSISPEPAPICEVLIDANFGEQSLDMFINENENDIPDNKEIIQSYASEIFKEQRCCCGGPVGHKYSQIGENRRKGFSYITPNRKIGGKYDCCVKIERMSIIDRLLPRKRFPSTLDPNICELCEPKRIFLSKNALAKHVNEEHISRTFRTQVTISADSGEEETSLTGTRFLRSSHAAGKKEKKYDSLGEVPSVDLPIIGKNIIVCKRLPIKDGKIEYGKKESSVATSYNHICDICNRRFLRPAGLASHKKTHKRNRRAQPPPITFEGEFKFLCNICDKRFQFCSDLVEHITFHNLSMEKITEILSSNVNKVANVQIDLMAKIDDQISPEDDDLNETFNDASFYNSESDNDVNFTNHIQNNPYKCDECGRLFTIKSVFQRHINFLSKVSDLDLQTKCPECDKDVSNRCELGAHIDSHKPPEEKQLSCEKCNKKFRCENNLIRHELEHEGKLTIKCHYCNSNFPSMADLHLHQKECKLKCGEYKCEICGKVFSAKWRLELHMKIDEKRGLHPHHSSIYFCDQCGIEFKHLNVLKRHVDSKCGTEPLFECLECKKKYFSQGALASHKRIQHSTVKNFICQYCSKDFFTKRQLHRHELRHNPSLRPYHCKYPSCEKIYRQLDSLKAHECEHTGFYPYACEFCGLQFSNVKSLKLHRKNSNHWSETEPNKLITQACKQVKGKSLNEKSLVENQTECDTDENKTKNLVGKVHCFKNVIGEKINVPPQGPQYSALQPFSVNQLIQHNQQPTVLIQSSHPLANYSQSIENYFVITTQESFNSGHHPHLTMN